MRYDAVDRYGRPNWDTLWMWQAQMLATRSSCIRKHTAAIFVDPDSNRRLCEGYNGAPPGCPTCLEIGCLLIGGHCKRCLHAEKNAIAHAVRYGVRVAGARVYSVARPCIDCALMLATAGIRDVWYSEEYDWPDREAVDELFLAAKINLVHFPTPEVNWQICTDHWVMLPHYEDVRRLDDLTP